MVSEFSIRAGTVNDVRPDSGEWVVIDLGFSESDSSYGAYRPGIDIYEVTFGEAVSLVLVAAGTVGPPLNLLLEAPLSAALNKELNPTPRSIERKFFQGKNQSRGWYLRAGAVTLVSAMTLLRQLSSSSIARDIRLFEGFAAFEWAGAPHEEVVLALWNIVRRKDQHSIKGADTLKAHSDDILIPAFTIDGSDFGIPPVIMA